MNHLPPLPAEPCSVANEGVRRLPPWWLILIWIALLIPMMWSVGVDADLWFHVLTGQKTLADGAIPATDTWSFTAFGRPLVNHQWLTQVLLAWSWEHGGSVGLLLMRAPLLLLALLALGMALWARWPHPIGVTFLLGFPLPAYAMMINLRPQGVTYAGVTLIIALLTVLRTGARWPLFVLAAMIPLWANMHAGFLFGIGILGAGVLALFWEGAFSRGQTALFLVLPGLSTLLNPYGVDLWRYIFKEFGAPHPNLPEWTPADGALLVIALIAFVIPMLATWKRRAPVRFDEWFGLITSFVMTLRGARFVILVMVFGSLVLASALGPRKEENTTPAQPVGNHYPALTVLLAALLLAFSFPGWGRPGAIPIHPKLYPVEAMAFLKASPAAGRLWCPLGWGGYSLFHLSDRVKVSLDGRNTTVYPVEFVVAQTLAEARGDLPPILDLKPDVLLCSSQGALFQALSARPEFTCVHRDAVAAVFTRADVKWPPFPLPASVSFLFPG